MSSRDHRRRERSWEREDRDRDRGDRYSGSRGSRVGFRDEHRKRPSRSRSPRERDRRDYRDRYRDDRRERESRRRDDSPEKDRDRERDHGREHEHEKDRDRRDGRREPSRREAALPKDSESKQDPDYFTNHNDNDPEDAEAGQEFEDDEAAMMATMGMTGFGTTKGKHVEGNQEGTVNIKKTRTWRQYMNRRGGFNRPLDKIK